MLRIYGSEFCPHCTACKKALDAEGTEYEYIDINKSLGALKEFLKLRDTDPVFKEVIGSGRVGIPALVLDDGSMTLDWEAGIRENKKLAAAAAAVRTGDSCRIDGTGC